MKKVSRGYQNNYSDVKKEVLNIESRRIKAMKITEVINVHLNTKSLKDKTCLDIGCSGGIITSILSEKFGQTIGCDIDEKAIHIAREQYSSENCEFLVADSMELPFEDNSFDIIICNHIYEHVPNSDILMDEIFRLLKTGGICYFSAGNKFMIIEAHYKLPFLSWLPQGLADIYMRLTGKGESYYERHLSYNSLLKLLRKFKTFDYSIEIISNPTKYYTENSFPLQIFNCLPKWVKTPIIRAFNPTFIFILRKEG